MISAARPVAYLCAEFAWRSDLPFYAGGLGVLARDTLMAAAQLNVPMIGVGLLYQGATARQQITSEGWQFDIDRVYDPEAQGFRLLMQQGVPVRIRVPLGEREVSLQVWEDRVSSNVALWLLDPNIDENPPEIRAITRTLYCCEDETQFQQAVLLGSGAFRLLQAMHVEPAVYHLNEGRPAIVLWELWQQARAQGLSMARAQALVRERVVYTNHTLLTAGNVTYDHAMVQPYAVPFAAALGVSVEQLLAWGRPKQDERFAFTELALYGSGGKNGVSAVHTNLCRKQWPQYGWQNVTNGVDLAFWQAEHVPSHVDPTQLWEQHQQAKHDLAQVVLDRSGYSFAPDRLVIGWARRITQYKQLDVLFADTARLAALARNTQRPIQLLIAGKAHPGDNEAKQLLQRTIARFQTELSGVALFVPDYDLELAQAMVRGCDVWLNTPEQGWEACGTSGMKAVSNGTLSMSVADGWVREFDWAHTGWVIPAVNVGTAWLDLLEHEVAPLYFTRDADGLPHDWIKRMQRSAALAPRVSAQRMLREYQQKLYTRPTGLHGF